MKRTESLGPRVHAQRRAAAFTALVTVLAAVPAFAQNNCADVTNKVSAAPVIVDGRFSGFTGSQAGIDEWSDIKPQAFTHNAAGQLVRTCPDDPAADALVYTATAPGAGQPVEALYLMYDFLRMDIPGFANGQVVAQVSFPITFTPPKPATGAPNEGPRQVNITVQFIARQERNDLPSITSLAFRGEPGSCASSFFDVFFEVRVVGDFNGDGVPVPPPAALDINGQLGFGTSSPTNSRCHGMAELEVGLRIPAGFGDLNNNGRQDPGEGFPPAGINPETGQYDPAPKFWGSSAKFDPNDPDPPVSSILTTINPDGSVSANSTSGGKRTVLDKLMALRSNTTDRRSRAELADAIHFLGRSLVPDLYQDPDRPTVKRGEQVFELEEGAVEELVELLRSRKTPAAVRSALPQCIDLLLKVDRMFAITAIDDAMAAHKDPKRIAEAKMDVAEGDHLASLGRSERAIEQYEEAWLDVTRRHHEHHHGHHDD